MQSAMAIAKPQDAWWAPCREVAVLLMICCFDALSSALLFHHGLATEANPVLRTAAEAGPFWFLWAKTWTFVPALAVAEWYRRVRPEAVLPVLRTAAFVYGGIYIALVARQFVG